MLFLASLLLFVLPLGSLLRFPLVKGAFISPLDIAAGLVFVLLAIKTIKAKQFPKPRKVFLALAVFFLVGVGSLALNSFRYDVEQILPSLLYAFRFLVYSSILFCTLEISERGKEKLQALLVVSGSLIVLFGFIQFVFYQNLRNLLYLGWDDHLYRLFSTFLDPNFAGAFFVLLLIYVGYLYYFRVFKNKFARFYLFVLSLLTLLAILLTHSRSAFIMLMVSVGIIIAKTFSLKKSLLTALLLLLVFVLFSNRHVENLNPLRMASTEARLLSINDALVVVGNNPIYGIGFNAYRYAQVQNGLKNETGALLSHADGTTDNSFLFVTATTGIIGLILYVNYYKQILFHVRKKGRIFLIALIVGLFVNSLFINSLFYPPIMVFANMIVGVIGFEKTPKADK